MMKKYIHSLTAMFFLAGVAVSAFAQHFPERKPYYKSQNPTVAARALSSLTVTPVTPAQLVSELLGPGAVITNLTFTGDSLALGSFLDPAGATGLDSGIVISTGNVTDIPGPNVSASTTTVLNQPGDSLLNTLTLPWPTYDAAVIAFDMQVNTDTLGCEFVFGSEEYPEFVFSNFNDVFAFFVSGPGITGTENIATLPGTGTIISINNVNDSLNSQFFIDNANGQELEFDGYTTAVSLQKPIQVGQIYHFRIAIADCGDQAFDSGIFLKKGSVLGYASLPIPNFTPTVNGLSVQFTNTTNYAQYYTWDFGDGTAVDTTTLSQVTHTYANPGNYTITLRAYNYYQVATCTQTLSLGGTGIPKQPAAPDIRVKNLSEGRFILEFGQPVFATVNVYAITGECVRTLESQGSEVQADLGDLPRGIYLLKVTTPARSASVKIVR